MILPEKLADIASLATTETLPVPVPPWRRVGRICLGVLLLLGGVAGLVLPILQGTLMILAALAILRKDIPLVARLWDRRIVPVQQRLRRWRSARRWR